MKDPKNLENEMYKSFYWQFPIVICIWFSPKTCTTPWRAELWLRHFVHYQIFKWTIFSISCVVLNRASNQEQLIIVCTPCLSFRVKPEEIWQCYKPEGKSTTCWISKDFESAGKSNSIGTFRILVRMKPKWDKKSSKRFILDMNSTFIIHSISN